MSLILFVLNDPAHLQALLDAWEQAGVGGVTILPSTGLGRIRQRQSLREDFPLLPDIEDFYRPETGNSQTLFTLVDDEKLVPLVLAATEKVVGDLGQPGHGILAVVPTTGIHGLIHRPGATPAAEARPHRK